MAAELLADESPMLSFMEEVRVEEWPEITPDDVSRRHDEYAYDLPKRKGARGSSRGPRGGS